MESEAESAAAIALPRPVVEVRKLRKTYRDGEQVHEALRGVDLTLRRGEIHGVLGASGAGKTTLLRCLLRLEEADEGELLIDGSNWSTLNAQQLRHERHRVGVVFQHLHLLVSRTVAENVALPLEIAGVPSADRLRRVQELLQWFHIAEKASDYPSRLSGGQRQRVALARALATKPSLLLADEPTSALDTETKLSVLETMRHIRDDLGVTILMITHDLRAAELLCDTLSILESGRIVETGSASEIASQPQSAAGKRLFLSTEDALRPERSSPPVSGPSAYLRDEEVRV